MPTSELACCGQRWRCPHRRTCMADLLSETPNDTTRRNGGLPTYFRANLLAASAGGTASYWDAGWHLGLHRTSEYSYSMETGGEEQAEKELDELFTLKSDP